MWYKFIFTFFMVILNKLLAFSSMKNYSLLWRYYIYTLFSFLLKYWIEILFQQSTKPFNQIFKSLKLSPTTEKFWIFTLFKFCRFSSGTFEIIYIFLTHIYIYIYIYIYIFFFCVVWVWQICCFLGMPPSFFFFYCLKWFYYWIPERIFCGLVSLINQFSILTGKEMILKITS